MTDETDQPRRECDRRRRDNLELCIKIDRLNEEAARLYRERDELRARLSRADAVAAAHARLYEAVSGWYSDTVGESKPFSISKALEACRAARRPPEADGPGEAEPRLKYVLGMHEAFALADFVSRLPGDREPVDCGVRLIGPEEITTITCRSAELCRLVDNYNRVRRPECRVPAIGRVEFEDHGALSARAPDNDVTERSEERDRLAAELGDFRDAGGSAVVLVARLEKFIHQRAHDALAARGGREEPHGP